MATKPKTKKQLFEAVQNDDSACVDRGEAIIELVRSGIKQKEIASSTNLSTSAISHLKKCSHNLYGNAREMCKEGKINGDACYSLASVPHSDQERILRLAIELREEKDKKRPMQQPGPKGRQTLLGQITDSDIKEVIGTMK